MNGKNGKLEKKLKTRDDMWAELQKLREEVKYYKKKSECLEHIANVSSGYEERNLTSEQLMRRFIQENKPS